MFKKHVGFLATVLLVLVLCSGCIESQAIGVYPGCQEIDIETEYVAQFLGISESEVDTAISDLNIKTYGVNGVSKNIIIGWYENRHQDWVLKKSEGTNLYSTKAWLSWFTGHVVSVSDHGSLQDLVGYDVVFLTSSAPLATYENYLDYF